MSTSAAGACSRAELHRSSPTETADVVLRRSVVSAALQLASSSAWFHFLNVKIRALPVACPVREESTPLECR